MYDCQYIHIYYENGSIHHVWKILFDSETNTINLTKGKPNTLHNLICHLNYMIY